VIHEISKLSKFAILLNIRHLIYWTFGLSFI